MAGRILLFGKLKDAFSAPSIDMPDGVTTAAELRKALVTAYPDLAHVLGERAMRIAVNQEFIADEAAARIAPGDEVALLPPLSGG